MAKIACFAAVLTALPAAGCFVDTGHIADAVRKVPVPPRYSALGESMHNQSRFSEAWHLIHTEPPDYARALVKLEANIAETPKASDADYDYGWAMVCSARLGHYRKALRYYKHLREHCYGWLAKGAGGANRNWERRCRETREWLASHRDRDARAVSARMEELDSQARARIQSETLDLVGKASNGDMQAAMSLQRQRYHEVLVDLIAEGRLVPVKQ